MKEGRKEWGNGRLVSTVRWMDGFVAVGGE